jgi:hypothetical protein
VAPLYKAWSKNTKFTAFPIDLVFVRETAYVNAFVAYMDDLKNKYHCQKDLSPDPEKHQPGTTLCNGWGTCNEHFIPTGAKIGIKTTTKNHDFLTQQFVRCRNQRQQKHHNKTGSTEIMTPPTNPILDNVDEVLIEEMMDIDQNETPVDETADIDQNEAPADETADIYKHVTAWKRNTEITKKNLCP